MGDEWVVGFENGVVLNSGIDNNHDIFFSAFVYDDEAKE